MLPSIRIDSWEDWTRVYQDVSVWRDLIDAICVREGIGYRRLQSASANTNAVFLLDRAFALKIYSPFWDEYDLERALLEALGPAPGIPAPELVGHGRIADGDGVVWPYLLTRFCAARPFSEIRRELSERDAASLAGPARPDGQEASLARFEPIRERCDRASMDECRIGTPPRLGG